jgi:hypothetical protein
MIIRIWNGTTTLANCDKYEQLLKDIVFPGIAKMQVDGYRGIQLLKRREDQEVNFITIMGFESMEAVKKFAGEDFERSYVINEAKALLKRYDLKATHYELLHNSISFS